MSRTCVLFSSNFSVKFIQRQFNGILVHQFHRPRHQLKDMLFYYAFNVLLAEFTSMHENKSLTHELRSRWDRVMLQYAVMAGLIQFALPLVQISDFAIGKNPPHHNRASSMFYGWCDKEGLVLFHQLFAAHRPSYLSQRFRTLIRQSKGLY